MRRYVPQHVTLIPSHAERVFKGVIFDVFQWKQEQFDGSLEIFEMIRRHDTVSIIGVVDDKIVLSKEEQPHVGEFVALPAGMHDHPEEDELRAAQREMREETGHIFAEWKLIDVQQPSEKIERLFYTFIATDLIEIVPQELDPGERIEPITRTLDEIKAMRETNELRFYPSHIFDRVDSLEELLLFPALYDYGNKD